MVTLKEFDPQTLGSFNDFDADRFIETEGLDPEKTTPIQAYTVALTALWEIRTDRRPHAIDAIMPKTIIDTEE